MPPQASLRLFRLALLAELRSPALRLSTAAAAALGAALAINAGDAVGSAGVFLASVLARVVGMAACLHLAYSANRDLAESAGAAYRSKPFDGWRWVALRCSAGVASWLVPLAAAFIAAALVGFFTGGPRALPASALGFFRASLVVLPLAVASFALSRMFRSPLGGIIVAFFWFCAIAGSRFIPVYLQPEYTQNLLLMAGVALLLLVIAGMVIERWRRGEFRRLGVALLAVAIAAGIASAGGVVAVAREPDNVAGEGSIYERMSLQYARTGAQIPGFWLPDGRGGIVRTAPHRGKILVVYLFDASSVAAGTSLKAMDTIAREFGDSGVQPLGIAISPDQGDGPALVLGGGYSFPIGYDPAARKASPPDSPMTDAFDVEELPLLAVTDRRGRITDYRAYETADETLLRHLVMQRLQVEPAP